ncbi:MAG: Ni/Fe hydrogenase subunit alpha [Holophagales bacterium]|nr:Ni/Fe hydrogenase subunit alpha [Holophagales bacterium]
MSLRTTTLKVDYLARVEGEGAMRVKVEKGRVTDVQLRIFEPPRLFEALLRGRDHSEAPDITARICGICPVAYQMSAVHAMEQALGVRVEGPLRELRRLLYCGEWIESHVLHMFLLHAPDFLGYEDAIAMAADHGELVEAGLELKKLGNAIVTLIGGREIHPINVKVGGFYRVPSRAELRRLREQLLPARDKAAATVGELSQLPMPTFEQDYELVALRHSDEYPFNEGRLVSTSGLDLHVDDYESVFREEHVAHSNALHSVMEGHGAYFVGPLARFALNFDRLSPLARDLARSLGLGPEVRNPFQSLLVRGVETVYAFDEALRILDEWREPESPAVELEPKAGRGHACTEAPRGILYHRYELAEDGSITSAKIVPPTSQNQRTIENDLRHFVERHLHLPHEELTWQCEQAIRNYDPCISCATHFLKLEIEGI